jgi:hypothetical protein
MKKLITTLSIATVSALILAGCANTPQTNTAELAAITLAATTGTELDLQSRPQDTIYFVGAEQVLKTLSTGTDSVSISTIEVALQSAGVTNVIVASSISEAITLGDSLIGQNTTNTSAQLIAFQQVDGAIATGISNGLSAMGKATLKRK